MDPRQEVIQALLEKELYVTDVFVDTVLKYMSVEAILNNLSGYTGPMMLSLRVFLDHASTFRNVTYFKSDVGDFECDPLLQSTLEIPSTKFWGRDHQLFWKSNVPFIRELIKYTSVNTKYITRTDTITIPYDTDRLFNVLYKIPKDFREYLCTLFRAKEDLLFFEYF